MSEYGMKGGVGAEGWVGKGYRASGDPGIGYRGVGDAGSGRGPG